MPDIKIYNRTTINNFGMAYRYTINLKDKQKDQNMNVCVNIIQVWNMKSSHFKL